MDVIGKFFGLEDKEIGYAEFDTALIIKTNDAEKTKNIFSDKTARQVLQSLTAFTLHTDKRNINEDTDTKEYFLEFEIERGIVEVIELRRIYAAFAAVLTAIELMTKKDLVKNNL
jgi:hypothetical protein